MLNFRQVLAAHVQPPDEHAGTNVVDPPLPRVAAATIASRTCAEESCPPPTALIGMFSKFPLDLVLQQGGGGLTGEGGKKLARRLERHRIPRYFSW